MGPINLTETLGQKDLERNISRNRAIKMDQVKNVEIDFEKDKNTMGN